MTVATEDKRTAKALAALEHTGQWLKVRNDQHRPLAYGIPSASTPGLYHFANSTQCTCPDYARFGNHCWHSRAVAMHVAAARSQPQPLTAVRHEDGEISWSRHQHTNGNVTYLPRRQIAIDATTAALAQRQADIFSKFYGEG